MKNIVGVDIETTGLSTEDRVIEYCGIVYDSRLKEVGALLQRINPKKSIDPTAQSVHHISLADLMGEPFWEDVAEHIHKQLTNAGLIVIHNAGFDAKFLAREFERIGLPQITTPTFCTMRSSRWATYNGKVPKLMELCFACGVQYDLSKAHGAKYDVQVMMECFKKICLTGRYDKKFVCPFNEVSENFYLTADNLSL